MSALIFAQRIAKSYGAQSLFQNLTLGVSEGDRIGILGPNGAGKSTLLRILAGEENPDEGTVTRRQYLRVAYIPQQTTYEEKATVHEVIEQAALASGVSAHDCVGRVREVMGKMGFEQDDQAVGVLSGGWQKRLALACGFVQHPDVMLVDEPTNHLDFEGIRWLERIMSQAPWPWIMVSHDRWFLEQATNKVAEVNTCYPDGLLMVPGNYGRFLEAREAQVLNQQQQMQALAGKVRREEAWLRRGPKARTTKAKYRVDTAHALQAELVETKGRLRQEEAAIEFAGTGRRTKQLVVAKHLTMGFDARVLLQNFDLVLSPGTAIGILGPNGSGKTTLLKILAKELVPVEGAVTHAENLQLVYFDQHRGSLMPHETLRATLSDTGHTVTYRGNTIHVTGWAKRFRFRAEQLDLPVERLSGGEQARAVIARLMLQPADMLIVDEPTNDLDIPTREILEECLKEFPGALVLVTHDRYMLEEVCTNFVGFDGQGKTGLFASVQQWEAWVRRETSENKRSKDVEKGGGKAQTKPQRKKLSFKDQREYDSMEQQVLQAEERLEQCRARVEDPEIAANHLQLQEAYEVLKAAEQTVDGLYARWAELEAKRHEG